jgi:hypothetical protein
MTAEDSFRDDAETIADLRNHRRVDVRLRVAIVLDRETACLARTLNLCEGGMLVAEYHGPRLQRGRLVGVNLRGVLSDGDAGEAEHYLMRVVRHAGDRLALRFATEL